MDERANLASFMDFYDETGANFFPFGVKSYRLHRAYLQAKLRRRRLLAYFLFFVRRLWVLYAFAPLAALGLGLLASSTVVPMESWQKWLAFVLGALLSVCMISVAAEGAYSATVFKTWAGPHHQFRKALMADLKVMVGAGLTTWCVASGYYYFVVGQFGGMKKIPGNADWFDRLILSLRNSWTTLIAQSDADPETSAANAATLIVQITGAGYVVILIGLFGGMLMSAGQQDFEAETAAARTSGERQGADGAKRRLSRLEERRVRGGIGLAAVAYIVWKIWHVV
ncbi:hypothetical protein [Amycolatopsis sp. NPDC051128]|uniref:hypothetical protein n=1 Tax=Amycolatopsis sp. NPDC051128 TaxID=3155412 RepID=UPI00342677AB